MNKFVGPVCVDTHHRIAHHHTFPRIGCFAGLRHCVRDIDCAAWGQQVTHGPCVRTMRRDGVLVFLKLNRGKKTFIAFKQRSFLPIMQRERRG